MFETRWPICCLQFSSSCRGVRRGSKQVCFLKGMMTSETQTRANVDPCEGITGPGQGSGASTLGGCSRPWQWVYVTLLGTTGMALHALSARPGDRGQAQE